MPAVLFLVFALLLPQPALAQFKGYYDVSALEITSLKEPAWGRKSEEGRLVYLCVDTAQCQTPTALTIKGVTRAEKMEDAFATGEFSPAKLLAQGKANAERMGSQFHEASPVKVGNIAGVHLEASANKIYFVTKFLGRGDQLLDIKVTSPDLDLARKLSDDAAEALLPQVFK